MKKGICERCGGYLYVNQHHIYPKKFFPSSENKETVQLCLSCHAEIHEKLPKEQHSAEFYKSFTMRFLGLLVLIMTLSIVFKIYE